MKKSFFILGIGAILIFVISSNSLGDNQWISIGPDGGMIHCVAIDPSNTSIVYAGTGTSGGGNGGVFKSTNGGASWSASSLTVTYVYALAIDPKNTSIVYAATDGGVFKSTDGGGSWIAINSGLTGTYARALAIDPKKHQHRLCRGWVERCI